MLELCLAGMGRAMGQVAYLVFRKLRILFFI